ncbi:DUF3306 domain-containing protein [Azospirillum soli]|uniref:DUF3306 domain-containing protein n=1 Tax=Azospirillum soli TaxID=1304799 RepID=UPI001AE5C10A|nr:DUF3306 domain-containing protein [Azospirillum soli]MBP2316748.1 hypothetical protein [Azospirillum soli]
MADSDANADEGFLGRWSRLKREAREEPPAAPAPIEEPAPAEEPFDPSTLPPLESLTADSDYTAFLAPQVPQELRLLALRKAWVSDPKIADFRGFAEYDWDFNAPGYGQLLPTDNIREMVENMFREEPPPAPEEPVAVAGAEAEAEETETEEVVEEEAAAAPSPLRGEG